MKIEAGGKGIWKVIFIWRRFMLTRFINPFSFIMLSLLLAGCGGIKMYPGPKLPADQIAVLRIGEIKLIAVDGQGVKQDTMAPIHILPGEHLLRASHNLSGYDEHLISYTFTAEAGHRYIFSATYEFGRTMKWRAWIKDMDTDETIGQMKQ